MPTRTILPLQELVTLGRRTDLMERFEAHKAVDIAAEAATLSDPDLRSLVDLLPSPLIASLVEEGDDMLTKRMVGMIEDEDLPAVLARMPDDEAADVVGLLDHDRVDKVLSRMRGADRAALERLLQYPDDTAGSIMTASFLSVRQDRTVEQCLALVRARGTGIEQIQTLYVVGRNDELLGYLDLRKILSSPRATAVAQIMEQSVISVSPYADQEEVAALVARYDLNALPVVAGGRLLGVVTVDDVIDVIIEEYDEDMLHLAGANAEETLATPLMDTVRMRLPWLLVNLVTAFLASLVVRAFEGTIEQVVALSAIMTVVSGMGGNAGSQTMAIVVRHLSKSQVSGAEVRRGLAKEAVAGLMDGAANGLVTGAVVLAIYGNPFLSLVVLGAMIGNMIIAGVSGFLVPVALKACGQDPAVASSIFVTTATDVLGFLLFLGMARAALPLLL